MKKVLDQAPFDDGVVVKLYEIGNTDSSGVIFWSVEVQRNGVRVDGKSNINKYITARRNFNRFKRRAAEHKFASYAWKKKNVWDPKAKEGKRKDK